MIKFTDITENMEPRGYDPTGHGHYGARRGNRKHKGYDLATSPGEYIYSPIHGVITKYGYPYASDLSYRYIEITGNEYRVRIMYAALENGYKKGDRVFRGDKIGVAQDIASKHNPNMVNHVHVEVYRNGLITDPEPLLEL